MKMDFNEVITTGRFRTFRSWNRKRNYYFKQLRTEIRLYIARLCWDRRGKSEFDLDSVKTVLLLRNEGTIGDVVVTTPLIRRLTEAGFTVDILINRSSYPAIQHNPWVRHIYQGENSNHAVFLKSFHHTVDKATIASLNTNRYDLVIDLCLFETPVHRLRLLRDIDARFVLGINQSKSINRYSKSVVFASGREHVTQALSLVASAMGVPMLSSAPYDLNVPDSVVEEVKAYCQRGRCKKSVVINAFTGSPERNFSQQQLSAMIDLLNKHSAGMLIIILDHRRELTLPLPENALINPFNSLHHVMAFIQQAELIISPDTAIVHISAVWKKPLISVYKNVADNNDLWGPGYDSASQIIVDSRAISAVSNVPELIMAEIARRGVLVQGRREPALCQADAVSA